MVIRRGSRTFGKIIRQACQSVGVGRRGAVPRIGQRQARAIVRAARTPTCPGHGSGGVALGVHALQQRYQAGQEAEHAAAFVATLDALGLADAHVCGHSFGALVALELAAGRYRHRVRSLVLLEPAPAGVLTDPDEGEAGRRVLGPVMGAGRPEISRPPTTGSSLRSVDPTTVRSPSGRSARAPSPSRCAGHAPSWPWVVLPASGS
ncbi:MAG TPA: alpha/beta fold hydrolase [Ornithinibacter sp.]|nr:alpha/beta fold hydrolase [Ornithinibacter sp.]